MDQFALEALSLSWRTGNLYGGGIIRICNWIDQER